MKGPFERLKYDLRRLWECPMCQRRERAPGSVTFRHCPCQLKHAEGKPVVMKLVADDVQRLTPPVVIHHLPLEPVMVMASASESEVPLPEQAPPATAAEVPASDS